MAQLNTLQLVKCQLELKAESDHEEETVQAEIKEPRSPSPPPGDGDDEIEPLVKRKKKMATILTEVQEIELKDWLLLNPMLYTKGMKEYRNTPKKIRMWELKAQEYGLESVAMLKTWYESIRTKVGKITDRKYVRRPDGEGCVHRAAPTLNWPS